MKKIFNIATLLAFVLVIASCSDDTDNPYAKPSTLKVISSDVIFSGAVDTGTVVVDAQQGISSVDFKSSWAKASVDGNKVTVIAEANPDLEGRSSLLTIWSGKDSVQVTVQQRGFALNLGLGSTIAFPNKTELTKEIEIEHSTDVAFTADDDWVSAKVEGNKLSIEAAPNTTGHIRATYLHYTSGKVKDSIQVNQGEFSDLQGQYYLFGYTEDENDPDKLETIYLPVELKKSGSSYILDIAAAKLKYPVDFDANTLSVTISGGQSLGTYTVSGTKYYVFSEMFDPVSGYLTWSTAAQMTAPFVYDAGSGLVEAVFKDNGGWGTHVARGILLELYKANTATSANRAKQYILEMQYPYLIKVPTSASSSKEKILNSKISTPLSLKRNSK